MKILVVGCGSIGERHIRNLSYFSKEKILAFDINKNRLNVIEKKYPVSIFHDFDKALYQKPDAVLVCTPPSSHIPIALMALENNAHVFIEKPLSNTMKNVNQLLRCSKKNKLIVFVGYNFRYQKGIQLVKKLIDSGKIGKILTARAEFGQYLPDWRPWQDYMESYTARTNLGGGIILDGSHEIDYLRWFFGEAQSIFCFAEKISKLKVETEDIAEILIRFKKKVLGEIHLDFVRPGYTRNCEIIGENGVITWDFSEKKVKIYTSMKKNWKTINIQGDSNDMYIKEMKHFIHAINTGEKPLTNGDEGRKTLEIALAAKNSAHTNNVVRL